jgi:hypothetical protein
MSYFYNAFGKLVKENNIETFATEENEEIESVSDIITQFKVDLETGKLSKPQVQDKMNYFKKLISEKKISEEDKKKLENVITTTVRTMDGINLVGNLELGGIIKAKGFHLHDGSRIKEVIRTKDKLAVPLDKEGNINLNPGKGKSINMTNLNIPKSGRITFGNKEDNDPYHLRKIGDKDRNHLRLTLNDNNNESLQIWGDSCKGDKCKPDGGTEKHAFYTSGDAVHQRNLVTKGNAYVKNDIIKNGGNNWIFHTPDDKRHTLYIAPSRTKGKQDWNWPKQTRFEANGEVVLNEGKHSKYNPTGWSTHFNHKGQGLNYIRGQTEMRGEVNFVDKAKGINIHNAKNGNNPSGGGTHFNYQGKGLNYIRGKTEMRGEVNFVDSNKGVNIYNKRIGGTHFNYQGKGLNYIRGQTEIRGRELNVITDKGIRVHSKGKVSSFGSQNSGWCHLTTNAPQFYMNKSLQVNGAVSSYHNKPLNANRGVNAPHYSRIGGDWLRINPEGNSAGRVAVYGGFSINDVRGGKAGLGVGYWGYPGRGNIRATGNIQANNGLKVTGGRTHFQDAERKGRLRVGAAWGIPGLYSEDRQDIVVGCANNRNVHLGRPNLVRIDGRGNLHLPRGANIYIGGRKVVKNGDPITLRSNRNGTRLQHSNWNQAARFSNRNRGVWERMYIETF